MRGSLSLTHTQTHIFAVSFSFSLSPTHTFSVSLTHPLAFFFCYYSVYLSDSECLPHLLLVFRNISLSPLFLSLFLFFSSCLFSCSASFILSFSLSFLNIVYPIFYFSSSLFFIVFLSQIFSSSNSSLYSFFIRLSLFHFLSFFLLHMLYLYIYCLDTHFLIFSVLLNYLFHS
jgi:hypothetical protein